MNELYQKHRLLCIAVLLLCLVSFVWMQSVSVSRFLTGHWYLADVGNIWACIANTAHGRFMWSPMMEVNHFACHFTPFLLLFVPFAYCSDYALPLVSGYVLAIALCPIPICLIALRKGLPALIAFLCGVLFLCNIYVGSLVLADHFEAWFVLFMLCTMAAWHRRGCLFWTFLLLTLSVREDACFWVFSYAVYEALVSWRHGIWHEQKKPFWQVCAVCILWGVLSVVVLSGVAASEPAGASNIGDYLQRFSGFGVGWDTLRTIGILVLSVGGVCLLGGKSLLLCLIPLPLLLVGFPFMRELRYYYSYPFLPFLIFATICGCATIISYCESRHITWATKLLAIWLLVFSFGQLFVPTFTDSYYRKPWSVSISDGQTKLALSEILPRDAKVAVSFGAFGLVPYRMQGMNMFEEKYISSDSWIVLWLARHCGMEQDRFVRLARSVMDEVQAGRRRVAYDRNDLLIISPVLQDALSTRTLQRF